LSKPLLSIVIPVYNRAWCVRRAVESAIAFGAALGAIEIVLVDDASTDDSVDVIERLIAEHGHQAWLSFKFVRHAGNKGVCGAKNTGAFAASGEWIVFLDSDDELLPDTANALVQSLARNGSYPLHFFRCVAETEAAPAMHAAGAEVRNFAEYFIGGTDGEALPVVRREVFLTYPYDQDINGYESLAYLRIARQYKGVVLNALAVRRYYTSHDSRLSSKAGMARRHANLAKGHLRVLKEHGRVMGLASRTKQIARFVKSTVLARVY